jgi:tRNA pseudouridine55 synthase
MNGMLLINKPRGWTSFDVAKKLRQIVQKSEFNTSNKKLFPVGHTGTLDPLATGLLVILLGNYTKKAPELIKLDKTYQVSIKLGETSTTGDEEGQKDSVSSRIPTKAEVTTVVNQFLGQISQIPPAFSAIKINGQRAYKLARAGKEVEMKPRLVTIFKISEINYDYPILKFSAHVSSGTYIRTLAEDIGKKLGTGAYMCDLHRTKIGKFDIKDSVEMDGLSDQKIFDQLLTLA